MNNMHVCKWEELCWHCQSFIDEHAIYFHLYILIYFVQCSRNRLSDWIANNEIYEELTVHDDESLHDSQYFRRYGHGFSEVNMEELCRIGLLVATAKSNVPIGGSTKLYCYDMHFIVFASFWTACFFS